MDTIECIEYEDEKYYCVNDLKELDNDFFKGTSKGIRTIIERKNIPENEYIYAYKKGDGWKKCKPKYPRSKILIKEGWLNENFPLCKGTIIKYDPVPPLIELSDEEKFYVGEGENIKELEIRGKRNYKECYFDVDIIKNVFGLKSIKSVITDERRHGYIKDKHYKFYTEKNGKDHNSNIKKKLYLTYSGLIRMLYVSRTEKAQEFQDWANEKLFAIQFGTEKQKIKLAGDLIGASSESIYNVFKRSVSSVPAVYLFMIDKVKNLRDKMNISDDIDDDKIVCKYGFTDDLDRRTHEHCKTYSKLSNNGIQLLLYSYIDAKYISDAETDVKELFEHMKCNIKYENQNELVVIDNKMLKKTIKKEYEKIHTLYGGNIKELINQLEQEKTKSLLEKEKHHREMAELKNELLMKDKKILELENEIIKKDYALLKLENDKLKQQHKNDKRK